LDGVAVTKHDTTTYDPCRAVWVGTGGDIAVKFAGNFSGDGAAASSVVIPDVPGGTLLPLSVVQVLSTGTTASGIVLLY
jgi:hypothetical protein